MGGRYSWAPRNSPCKAPVALPTMSGSLPGGQSVIGAVISSRGNRRREPASAVAIITEETTKMRAVGTTITDLGTLLVHSSHQPRSGKYLNAALGEGFEYRTKVRANALPWRSPIRDLCFFLARTPCPYLPSVAPSSHFHQKETLGPFVLVELSPPRRHWSCRASKVEEALVAWQ